MKFEMEKKILAPLQRSDIPQTRAGQQEGAMRASSGSGPGRNSTSTGRGEEKGQGEWTSQTRVGSNVLESQDCK